MFQSSNSFQCISFVLSLHMSVPHYLLFNNGNFIMCLQSGNTIHLPLLFFFHVIAESYVSMQALGSPSSITPKISIACFYWHWVKFVNWSISTWYIFNFEYSCSRTWYIFLTCWVVFLWFPIVFQRVLQVNVAYFLLSILYLVFAILNGDFLS